MQGNPSWVPVIALQGGVLTCTRVLCTPSANFFSFEVSNTRKYMVLPIDFWVYILYICIFMYLNT